MEEIKVVKDIRSLGRKKVTLQEIGHFYAADDYETLRGIVISLIKDEILKPVKSGGTNGKSPALSLSYRVSLQEEDDSGLIKELKYALCTRLDNSYYLKNIKRYREDRENVMKLSAYLLNSPDKLKSRISLNERSFEIWGREKFLGAEGGIRVIRNLGLIEEDLNYYTTTVPLAYYSHSKETPQNVLILENKDTFYSMRKHLLESGGRIFGTGIGTLVYGGGKNIYRSFEDFDVCVEPYITDGANTILYLGDIDYEGIIIYESLKRSFEKKYTIKLFTEGYKAMVDKRARTAAQLPRTKEKQNRNISAEFLDEFEKDYREAISGILRADEYIPQEILNIGDF
jgi:hypothetical protein